MTRVGTVEHRVGDVVHLGARRAAAHSVIDSSICVAVITGLPRHVAEAG